MCIFLSAPRSLPLLNRCGSCHAAGAAPDSKERATPRQVGEPQRDVQAMMDHIVLGSATTPQEVRPAAPGRLGGLTHPVAGASGLASLALAEHPAAEAAAATAQAAFAKPCELTVSEGCHSGLTEQVQVHALACKCRHSQPSFTSHSMPMLCLALQTACLALA